MSRNGTQESSGLSRTFEKTIEYPRDNKFAKEVSLPANGIIRIAKLSPPPKIQSMNELIGNISKTTTARPKNKASKKYIIGNLLCYFKNRIPQTHRNIADK